MLLRVTRPPSLPDGSRIVVQDPSGSQFYAIIPPGVAPGGVFYVRVTVAAPQPSIPVALAVPRIAPAPAGPAASQPQFYISAGNVPMGLTVDPLPLMRPSPPPPRRPPPLLPQGPAHETLEEREERELAEALSLSGAAQALSLVEATSRVPHPGLYPPHGSSTPCAPSSPVDTSHTFAAFNAGGILADRQLEECSICFEALCSDPCAVLCCSRGRRVCSHLLHSKCAALLHIKTCPLCRAEFSSIKVLPDLRADPHAWFSASDVLGDGRLSRSEVINVLLSQFPLDVAIFQREMEQRWPGFDPNGDGYVTREEFFEPSTGLLAFVQAHLTGGGSGGGGPGAGELPDVVTDRNKWFDYFDADQTGELNPEELTRALIKTYALGTDLQQVQTTRDLVAAVWPAFTSGRTISRRAFLQPGDGLADTIIASLNVATRQPQPQTAHYPL